MEHIKKITNQIILLPKKYFNTPKMTLGFYYTDTSLIMTLLFSLMLIINYYSGGGGSGILYIIIFSIYLFLCIYSFAWFTDYMLYKYGKNFFIRLVFNRTCFFKKEFVASAAIVFATTPQEYTMSGNKAHRTYDNAFSNVKTYFLVAFFLKLLVVWPLTTLYFLLPFFHPFVIKQYKKAVYADELTS